MSDSLGGGQFPGGGRDSLQLAVRDLDIRRIVTTTARKALYAVDRLSGFRRPVLQARRNEGFRKSQISLATVVATAAQLCPLRGQSPFRSEAR